MRIFHVAILAYCFFCIGCGFKTTPVWRDDIPQSQSKEETNQKTQVQAIKK